MLYLRAISSLQSEAEKAEKKMVRRICYVVLLSCEFSIDTARVELKCSDGSMRAINCCAVEDEYAKTIRQRSALD